MIVLSQNPPASKTISRKSEVKLVMMGKKAPARVSHLSVTVETTNECKIAVTLEVEWVILKTTSGMMDVLMTGWGFLDFFLFLHNKVSLCVFVRVIQTKRNQGVSEELISTLLLSVERSDEYSYYVNDCSCVCAADPDFAFCVAASFTQRSKC